MKTNIGITDPNRQEVANALSKVLANEYILLTKTRNAHWNVTSPDFIEKHRFFDFQIGQIDKFIDKVAERIRMIGHYAPAKLKSFIDLTQLSETTKEDSDSLGFIRELLSDHETIIIKLRENIPRFADEFKDYGSSDFITGLMEDHEKMAWILRSHL